MEKEMVMRQPAFRKRTIQCIKGSAELAASSGDRPDHVCFSLHGPRGGFAGNFWFPGQDLADILAELGFAVGQQPTRRSAMLETVLATLGRVDYVQKARPLGERILLLAHALGGVAQMVARGNLRGVKKELALVAAMAMGAMTVEELDP